MASATRIAYVGARRLSLAVVATALCLALALGLAYVLNIWQDEAYTLHATALGPSYAFYEALRFEQNAPLYFVVLSLWRGIDGSVFFLRLFSVLCACGAVALVPSIARRYLPRSDPGFVTLAVALNPFLIWAAVEMRVYALLVLLSAALLLTAHDAFLAARPQPRSAFVYALLAALALYTQYYMLFLIAAQGVTVLAYRPRMVWRFALAAAVALLAFAPLAAVIPSQVSNFRGAFAHPTLIGSFAVTASILARYVLPIGVPHANVVYVALVVALAVAAALARRSFAWRGDGTIVLTTLFAALFFAAGTYVAGVHVLNRHVASLFVPAICSAFALLSFLRPAVRVRANVILLCLMVSASIVALVQTYAHLAKPGDWIRLNAYLEPRERPHEPIVVFEAENALPFALYYRGRNAVVALPQAVDFRRYDVSAFVVHDEATMQRVMPHARALWLITAGECASANIEFGCDVVESYVALRYRVASDARFYESRLRLLIPKS